MKKILLVLVFAFTVTLAACSQLGINVGDFFDTDEEILSFQAFAAASILTETNQQTLSNQYSNTLLTNLETEEENDDDPIVDSIEPYLELIEKYLSTNGGLVVTTALSDLPEYQLMMSFQTKGLMDEDQIYVIHYNMVLNDDEDDEEEFHIEGILIAGELTYQLTGKREVEDDEEEFKMIAKIDDLNYVESRYELESDETKFEIKVVINGIIVSESEIKIEVEEDETKLELEFFDGVNTGKYEFKFEIEDGIDILKIEFEVTIDGVKTSGEMVLEVIVDELTGETSYQIFVEKDNGESYSRGRKRDVSDQKGETTEDNEPSEDSDPTDIE